MSEDKKYCLSDEDIEKAYEDLLFRRAMALTAEEESLEIEEEILEMPPLSEEDIERKKKEFEALLQKTVEAPEKEKTEEPKKKKGLFSKGE